MHGLTKRAAMTLTVVVLGLGVAEGGSDDIAPDAVIARLPSIDQQAGSVYGQGLCTHRVRPSATLANPTLPHYAACSSRKALNTQDGWVTFAAEATRCRNVVVVSHNRPSLRRNNGVIEPSVCLDGLFKRRYAGCQRR
jgi:hypothetical protein